MNLEASHNSLLSFAWTLTRPTNYLGQNIVFSYSEMSFFFLIISLFFVFLYINFLFYVILLLSIFTKTMLLLSFYLINVFFHENYFYFFMFRDVPGCSGMFRNVPCSWFYRRPIRNQFEQQWFHVISFQKPRRVYTAIWYKLMPFAIKQERQI